MRIIIFGSDGFVGRSVKQALEGSHEVHGASRENKDAGNNNHYVDLLDKETAIALEYRDTHNLPVTVARIFNPIGHGMHPRFLIPQLIQQTHEILINKRAAIEVSRLNAKRDYIDVNDVATAIKTLVEGN